MNRFEMRNEFLTLYDRVASLDAPGYEDDEISIFLTKAQERVLISHYRQFGNKFLEGFEMSEKRRKDLSELISNVTLTLPSTDQVGALPDGIFYDLPNDFLYAISEEVLMQVLDCRDVSQTNRVRVLPITHDSYIVNIENPFRKPYNNLVWRLDYSTSLTTTFKRHELITNGNNIVSYNIRYIKRPTPIIITALNPLGTITSIDGYTGPLDCTLDASLHRDIIDIAVQIATGVTNPQEYQIKAAETQQGD